MISRNFLLFIQNWFWKFQLQFYKLNKFYSNKSIKENTESKYFVQCSNWRYSLKIFTRYQPWPLIAFEKIVLWEISGERGTLVFYLPVAMSCHCLISYCYVQLLILSIFTKLVVTDTKICHWLGLVALKFWLASQPIS